MCLARMQPPTQAAGEAAVVVLGCDRALVRLAWQQMLTAVQVIHDARIVHGDLKPANFLFVHGQLKLIDFGIASQAGEDTTNIYRETQIGTVNYMSPEVINDEP